MKTNIFGSFVRSSLRPSVMTSSLRISQLLHSGSWRSLEVRLGCALHVLPLHPTYTLSVYCLPLPCPCVSWQNFVQRVFAFVFCFAFHQAFKG